MARRKDKRRRRRPDTVEPAATAIREEPITLAEPGEPAPERLRAPGGTGPMIAFIALSAVVGGLLLSGWTPRSVETTTISSSPAPPAGTAPQPPGSVAGIGTIPAKNIFGAYCGICHTLAAVGSVGLVGPDLDQLRPTRAEVLRAIREGGRGTGQMPPGILHGKPAERVARYVASVAGR